MPQIHRHACDRCDFELPDGWGCRTYAVDDAGRRHVCPHPGEGSAIRQVTGMSTSDASDAGRCGVSSDCVCTACLRQFELDLERDLVVCPVCGSAAVRSVNQLIDQLCPKCGQGRVRRMSPIRWALDPDRGDLPVPQVVKDLVEYAQTHRLPPSLAAAEAICRETSDDDQSGYRNTVWSVCSHLLEWWLGQHRVVPPGPQSSGTDLRECTGEYQDRWPWIKAFKRVVAETPALAAFVEWRDGRFWFRPDATPALKRGIKNYVREHYEVIVES